MFLIVFFFIHTLSSIMSSLPSSANIALSMTCSALAGWVTWQLASGNRINTFIATLSGALILGALCFTVGFLAPMAIAKEANQGPLIGIFIATPFGLIVGAIGGYILASRQKEV